jgi:hypothetical protein
MLPTHIQTIASPNVSEFDLLAPGVIGGWNRLPDVEEDHILRSVSFIYIVYRISPPWPRRSVLLSRTLIICFTRVDLGTRVMRFNANTEAEERLTWEVAGEVVR